MELTLTPEQSEVLTVLIDGACEQLTADMEETDNPSMRATLHRHRQVLESIQEEIDRS